MAETKTRKAQAFVVPDAGENVDEVEILDVKVTEGDEVAEGDSLFTIETDKASTDIDATFSGRIESVEVGTGDTVGVGDVLLRYRATDGDREPGDEDEDSEGRQSRDDGPSSEAEDEQSDADGDEKERAAARDDENRDDENRDDDDQVEAKAADDAPSEAEEGETDESPGDESGDESKDGSEDDGEAKAEGGRTTDPPAAPITRRLARELNVALADVEGSGPHGRVSQADVRARADQQRREARRRETQKKATGRDAGSYFGATDPLPDFSRFGPIEPVALRGIRRKTAERMAAAWREIPHVTHHDVADVTALTELRDEIDEAGHHTGGRLTLTVFVLKAAVAALKAFPPFNASFDASDETVILKHYYHIGIAVDTDRGLLVPVIRDVDRKSVTALADEVDDLVRRARSGDLDREELAGGSFTITNSGPIGGTGFTPIVNPPQSAILGVSRAAWKPTDVGDGRTPKIETRLQLPLCLSFDHRVADGADAARFMRRLSEILGGVDHFLLGV